MILRLNTALRNRLLDCLFDSGTGLAIFDSGTVEFRTGAQPASADSAATGTVIAAITLPANAMGAAASGTTSKTVTAWEDTAANAAGTMGYARFYSTGGTYVMDIDVTDTTGVGGIKVDNPVLVIGQDFLVTDFSITMPATT